MHHDKLSENHSESSTEQTPAFARIPQPYHLHEQQLRTSLSGLHLDKQSNGYRDTISDGSKASKGKSARTPSESGTDADDESFTFTKALPPPPLRPRKGLRDAKGADLDAAGIPFLTLSKLDDGAADHLGVHDTRRGDRSTADEETREIRLKTIRRRRAELLRRLAEVSTLAALGVGVGWRDQSSTASSHQHAGEITQESGMAERQFQRAALRAQISIVIGLCLLYPIRLIAYAWKRTAVWKPLWSYFQLPSSFDPAPILYPPLLPAVAAFSFIRWPTQVVMTNVVLGIASLPYPLIPSPVAEATASIHWVVAELPLAYISATANNTTSSLLPDRSIIPSSHQIDSETVSLLFPLHQALVSFLCYLTKTSLLPAELQLLSIGLINLLLFSAAPYAIILGTLLWMGGLGVYITCGRVVRWGIALARIPRWRLKRTARAVQASQHFSRLLGRTWNFAWLGQPEAAVDSDADDDPDEPPPRPRLRIDTLRAEFMNSLRSSFFRDDAATRSAVEPPPKNPFVEGLVNGEVLKRRRNTLPSLDQSFWPSAKTVKRRRRTLGSSLSQSFLRLSPEQAQVRKWLYAAYVYAAILVLAMVPIRLSIEKNALGGHEPFGWAIGYLFADIPLVRQWTRDLHLSTWISFPTRVDSEQPHGLAEHLRREVIGIANSRLIIAGHCLAVLALGMAMVFRLTAVVEVDTRRKVFHGMMVAMLLPSIYVDPAFVALALALVLVGFVLLDLLRASQLPPLSKPIAYFLTPYVDGRDLRGPVVVSHLFLMVGCAVPLWMSLADSKMVGDDPWAGWEVKGRDTSMVSGVVCVGMGDAAASLIGRRYGRRKWPWAGGKSLEGSAAFAFAVTVGLTFSKIWMWLGQWDDRYPVNLSVPSGWIQLVGKAGIAACIASFMEAVLTGGNDNVIVPIMLWLTVRALAF